MHRDGRLTPVAVVTLVALSFDVLTVECSSLLGNIESSVAIGSSMLPTLLAVFGQKSGASMVLSSDN